MKRNTSYTKLFTIFFITVDIKLLLEVITPLINCFTLDLWQYVLVYYTAKDIFGPGEW